jgi:isopentenyl-diphosphate delta-isomerase
MVRLFARATIDENHNEADGVSGAPSKSDGVLEVVLVNALDETIGYMEKTAAHQLGVLHRAFSVFLFDNNDRLLLQRRNPRKYHSGGLWSNTCCGHPTRSETITEAAKRRLFEEMGIKCKLSLQFRTSYREPVPGGLIENEIVHVFAGRFDGSPEPSPIETMDWKWSSIAEIDRELAMCPDLYTVWFRRYWAECAQGFLDKGIHS